MPFQRNCKQFEDNIHHQLWSLPIHSPEKRLLVCLGFFKSKKTKPHLFLRSDWKPRISLILLTSQYLLLLLPNSSCWVIYLKDSLGTRTLLPKHLRSSWTPGKAGPSDLWAAAAAALERPASRPRGKAGFSDLWAVTAFKSRVQEFKSSEFCRCY